MTATAGGATVWHQIIWNEEPGGNIEHVEEHGLTVDDVEHGPANPDSEGVSRSSGLPCVFGTVPDGRYIIVVYEEVDADTTPWGAQTDPPLITRGAAATFFHMPSDCYQQSLR
jgi:hypothetical protein